MSGASSGQREPLTVGSLFAGIGGWDLGLERTGGFQTVWFCEQDPYCQRVLAKHWPGVPCYPDVTELRGADVQPVDVLCGGFPCQDISVAGRGEGIEGARSGLWSEYARLIGELGPRYVLVENVAALLARGLGTVLADLATLGYDAEWDCVPASAVGAPHRRDRVWLVAYTQRTRLEGLGGQPRGATAQVSGVGDTGSGKPVADPYRMVGPTTLAGDGASRAVLGPGALERALGRRSGIRDQWGTEPDVGRVADGVPARVDRLRALGNALVPQIPEWIGHRILEHEASKRLDIAA